MRLYDVAALVISSLLGRVLRRVAIFAAMAYFVIASISYFIGASTIALTEAYGVLRADLIVGGIYAGLALISFIVLWLSRSRSRISGTSFTKQPREMQIVMLLEALMLGYALAKKRERTR